MKGKVALKKSCSQLVAVRQIGSKNKLQLVILVSQRGFRGFQRFRSS